MISLINNFKYLPFLLISSCIAPPSLYQEAFFRSKEAITSNDLVINKAMRDLPYAMQLAKIGNSDEVLLVLAEARYDYLTWSSSSKELITTFNGKIIKTSGLINDINIINPPNIKNVYLNIFDKSDKNKAHRSFIDFSSPKASSLEIYYSYEFEGVDIIKSRLNDKEITTTLIAENYNIPIIKFKGVNFYWINSEGSVVKSIQKIEPYGKNIRLQSLKKYNGN